MGIKPMPWQETAAKYVTAMAGEVVLFREVCIVAARQNGKTTLTKPLIVKWLEEGKRVLHVAQTRELPREMFRVIAADLDESLFLKRRGKGGRMQTVWPRFGAGQEEILLANGGSYRIAAATPTGSRGWSMDRVLVDELLAMDDHEAMRALEPTITAASDGGQIVYLSNAGSELSVVLNAVRDRAGADDLLAYLEWSAHPDRMADDIEGWAEANPSMGHNPSLHRTLEAVYRKHTLEGTLSLFETERLCRWVKTMRETLVSEFDWGRGRVDNLGPPLRPVIGVSLDPDRRRASAVLAWTRKDGSIALRELIEATADGPIDTDALGEDIKKEAMRHRVLRIAYDPLTDAELAKYLKKPEPVSGQKFANASSQFVSLVEAGKIAWTDADHVTDDLTWTARRSVGSNGSYAYEAVRAQDDRPITAALAAIRAVGWLASGPRPAAPRIY